MKLLSLILFGVSPFLFIFNFIHTLNLHNVNQKKLISSFRDVKGIEIPVTSISSHNSEARETRWSYYYMGIKTKCYFLKTIIKNIQKVVYLNQLE